MSRNELGLFYTILTGRGIQNNIVLSPSYQKYSNTVISKALFFMFIRHSEGAVIVVVVARYIDTSCFTYKVRYARS